MATVTEMVRACLDYCSEQGYASEARSVSIWTVGSAIMEANPHWTLYDAGEVIGAIDNWRKERISHDE